MLAHMLLPLCHLPLFTVPVWMPLEATAWEVSQSLFGIIILNDPSKMRGDPGAPEVTHLGLP